MPLTLNSGVNVKVEDAEMLRFDHGAACCLGPQNDKMRALGSLPGTMIEENAPNEPPKRVFCVQLLAFLRANCQKGHGKPPRGTVLGWDHGKIVLLW